MPEGFVNCLKYSGIYFGSNLQKNIFLWSCESNIFQGVIIKYVKRETQKDLHFLLCMSEKQSFMISKNTDFFWRNSIRNYNIIERRMRTIYSSSCALI